MLGEWDVTVDVSESQGGSQGVSIFQGKGIHLKAKKKKIFILRRRGCVRDCEPVPPWSAVCHQFSPLVLDIMVPITKNC